ncbi:unnamed protein product [Effrenium voratum]|nr:unnamed protein product [Effrenium voratum]
MVRWHSDKGFGFIKPDDGSEDLFAHVTALADGDGSIQEGDKVTYDKAIGWANWSTKLTNGSCVKIGTPSTGSASYQFVGRAIKNCIFGSTHSKMVWTDAFLRSPPVKQSIPRAPAPLSCWPLHLGLAQNGTCRAGLSTPGIQREEGQGPSHQCQGWSRRGLGRFTWPMS